MKITLVYGQSHKGSTYHIARSLADKLGGEINEIFLPRDFSDYCVGDDYMKLGYIVKPIVLKKGCLVGMESCVMPGVTIGEGAIVGAGSLVTKDIPAWTIAVGRPAKVIKEIPKREE